MDGHPHFKWTCSLYRHPDTMVMNKILLLTNLANARIFYVCRLMYDSGMVPNHAFNFLQSGWCFIHSIARLTWLNSMHRIEKVTYHLSPGPVSYKFSDWVRTQKESIFLCTLKNTQNVKCETGDKFSAFTSRQGWIKNDFMGGHEVLWFG